MLRFVAHSNLRSLFDWMVHQSLKYKATPERTDKGEEAESRSGEAEEEGKQGIDIGRMDGSGNGGCRLFINGKAPPVGELLPKTDRVRGINKQRSQTTVSINKDSPLLSRSPTPEQAIDCGTSSTATPSLQNLQAYKSAAIAAQDSPCNVGCDRHRSRRTPYSTFWSVSVVSHRFGRLNVPLAVRSRRRGGHNKAELRTELLHVGAPLIHIKCETQLRNNLHYRPGVLSLLLRNY